MRTIAAHAHHRIDDRVVELTMMRDLPDLIEQILIMLTALAD